jgi:hypothetical protein
LGHLIIHCGLEQRWQGAATFRRVNSTQTRGIVSIIVGAIGIVMNIIDGTDDGFSLWNGIAIVCFLIMIAYGFLYLTERRTINRR